MNVRLVASDHDSASRSWLQGLYDRRLIPAEKKPFLVNLRDSFGPHLAIDGTDQFIFDACSQIATIGLGFNASPLFAPCQHIESWTGDYTTENIQAIANASRNLLKRLLGQSAEQHHVHFCASGAEAIEISLGLCFEHRRNRQAKKVLAFEGSFHGRMLVALSATWSPKKREPFAWPGHESDFAPYPEISPGTHDAENQSLEVVEQKLQTGKFFAVLIEPMQCEGGDRYSSPKFHQRLRQLTESFGVPLVYDEVQTGFHLGDRFFWHSQFELSDTSGQSVSPDVIVCAKKAQTGVVISKYPVPFREVFCPASLIRGYVTASMIDQYDDQILGIGNMVRDRLAELIEKYRPLIANPRSQGTAFAFDFKDADALNRFVKSRFDHGLLFYPAGDRTARFRLNLSVGQPELLLLFQQLDLCIADLTEIRQDSHVSRTDAVIDATYQFHADFANFKRRRLADRDSNSGSQTASAREYLLSELPRIEDSAAIEIVELNARNFPLYRDRILQLQVEVYEPVRRTPAAEFEALFNNDQTIESPALLLIRGEQIVAMAFCGPLSSFKQERGVADDPLLNDDRTFYMLDLTVAPNYRARGLGRILKNALSMLAAERGIQAIHGRNRDRLARAMWAINLSLGSFATRHLVDDYPDGQLHRDCIYYRCPLAWNAPPENSSLPFAQLDIQRIDPAYFSRNAPALVNKICLSNFVTRTFLDDLETVAQTLPAPVRHLYTASSLAESIDKVAKAIWLKRQPRNRLLTIAGHYFGEGSFLARALSGIGDPYFDVERMDSEAISEQLRQRLDDDCWLAFFVQTDLFADMFGKLAECIEICQNRGVPIVFNETGPRFGSDDQTSRQLFQLYDLLPDAGVVWLGGQMSLTYTNDFLFADDPLLLISTWDGDAYSLARFAETLRQQNDRLRISNHHLRGG